MIKNKFQKGGLYQKLLTPPILSDVCQKITGHTHYTVEFINSINKGRQAKLFYENEVYYISFSENRINSRNSSFQSFPTALINYLNETNPHKKIFFYILDSEGNIETDYFVFMYRLMKTVGTNFLNESENLSIAVTPFSSFKDIMLHKSLISGKNKANNSTYITETNNIIQIYGKLYGANKYQQFGHSYIFFINSLNILFF